MRSSAQAALLGAAVLLLAVEARGQVIRGPGFVPGWERTGRDFHPNGVWRPRARAVAAVRAQLLARRDFAGLSAAVAPAAGRAPSRAAVTGVLTMPAILFTFADSPNKAPFTQAMYDDALFAAIPPGGRPYTLRTFYEELSNGAFSMQGQAHGWTVLPGAEATYTGAPGSCPQNPIGTGNCNGIWSGAALAALHSGLSQAVAGVDPGVDFGLYDNDGPDGLPNSGDDDGFVDVTIFLHSEQDGACGGSGNNHPWAHRYQLTAATADPRNGGGVIRIRDYLIQSGVGGAGSCTATQLMPVGTAAHELGHGLGLPDLYDTGGPSEGIGEWGLMGSGNYASALSPSRMEAWSLNELGWITLRDLTAAGTYTLGATPASDTALVIRPTAANPRGEYFLLENRQALQADTALLRIACGRSGNPAGCGGGLLIWHVDPLKIAQSSGSNSVNVGAIHGVDLVQADNQDQLRVGINRGDAADPYPGTASRTGFGPATAPVARLNGTGQRNGAVAGFEISAVQLVGAARDVSLQVTFGGTYLIEASDPVAQVRVDGNPTTRFEGLLAQGATTTLSMDSPQPFGDGRRRFLFASWSDGGAQTHDVIATVAGDTLTATVTREYELKLTVLGGGAVAVPPGVDPAGTFLPEGSAVLLSASPDSGFVFSGWSGDTTATGGVLSVPMGRPYHLTATFSPTMAISSATNRPAGVMGAGYADTLVATGGAGGFTWAVTAGALPGGLTLAPNGTILGVPEETGDFTFTGNVSSGVQVASRDFSLTVTAPALASGAVVSQITGGGSPLSAPQLRYLDLLGNDNGRFDVGDFLAWVRLTGAPGALEQFLRARRSPLPPAEDR